MKNLFNTNFVLGEGPIPCTVMLIGEAPGQTEDQQGRPFCGLSGSRLTMLLRKEGYKRTDVYITNAVKQRPPQNRKPTIEEIIAHREYLTQEIVMVKPKVIVTLGKTALEAVLGREISTLSGYFGRKIMWNGNKGRSYTHVLPTYHPAALLRNKEYLIHMEKTLGRIESYVTREKGKV